MICVIAQVSGMTFSRLGEKDWPVHTERGLLSSDSQIRQSKIDEPAQNRKVTAQFRRF